jgi:hypothetical protein
MVKHLRFTLHFYTKVAFIMHAVGVFARKHILLPALRRLVVLWFALDSRDQPKRLGDCGGSII